jgi:hypothetical protein
MCVEYELLTNKERKEFKRPSEKDKGRKQK